MKIFIVTPVWGRENVSPAVIASWPRDETWDIVVAGSERKKSQKLYKPLAHYVEVDNHPLGAKFNTGICKAIELGADYICIMGSDTLASPATFRMLANRAANGAKYMGITDLWIADKAEAKYWPGYVGRREGEPIGPARVISVDLLRGDMYQPDLNRNLDASLTRVIGLPDPENRFRLGPKQGFVSLKTPGSITPMRHYKTCVRSMPTREFFAKHYPDLAHIIPHLN